MSITDRDKLDLQWFYSQAQASYFRSAFGAILDMQAARYYDSCGEVLPIVEARSWLYMHVKPEAPGDVSYEPQHATSMRVAVVSRRLRAIGPRHEAVLEAYYGDAGKRWEGVLGRDAVGAVFKLTGRGVKYLHDLIRLRGDQADGDSDAILEAAWRSQVEHPDDIRGARHRAIESEARALLECALGAYGGARC